MTTTTAEDVRTQIADVIHARQRFVVVSHARPDGDAVGRRSPWRMRSAISARTYGS
jgi:hypothetical protein